MSHRNAFTIFVLYLIFLNILKKNLFILSPNMGLELATPRAICPLSYLPQGWLNTRRSPIITKAYVY